MRQENGEPNRGRQVAAFTTRSSRERQDPLLGNRQPGSGNRPLYPHTKRPCATPPSGGVGLWPFVCPLAGVRERPWFGAPFSVYGPPPDPSEQDEPRRANRRPARHLHPYC